MPSYMYRAHITSEPQFETYTAFDNRELEPQSQEWNRPVGWTASPEYIERFNTDKFFEPRTDKWFKSRSSAAERVKLLRSMGYGAIVQRSAPIEWPAPGEEKVTVSASRQVQQAVKTLIEVGIIRSADDLFA